MRQAITGLIVQVEVTGYDDNGKVAGRPEKAPTFQVLEAMIPPEVMAWVKLNIGMKEG